MKIAFGIILCNGDDFLEECVQQVYDFADQIVIAEGATRTWMRTFQWETPESKDKTNDILKRLKKNDKDNKISIVHSLWDDKIHQSNGYMELVDDDTDYIWQLDSDEFYMFDDLEKVKNYLIKESPSYVTVKQLHFFKNFETIATGQSQGWGWETPQPRIQKFYKGCRYIEHRPPMIVNPQTNIPNDQIKLQNLTEQTEVMCFHYSYVTDKQVREKMAYYAEEFPQAPRLKTWIKDVWEQWDINKFYVERTFGTHPTAWQNSITVPYKTIHPEHMREKVNNGN